ncbi:hypothetical protein KI387_001974, partial [Taxus chinensis]
LKGKTWGFIGVRLSNGPHYHRVQIADAVVIAKYLGSTLLLPTIKDGHKEPNGQFEKIYDTSNFITSLQNIVRVVGRLPDDMTSVSPELIHVPYRVTGDYIDEHIRPIFNQKVVIILDSVLPDVNLKEKEGENAEHDAVRCLVMYKALRFHSQLIKLGSRILNRVREAGEMSDGRFIAVDLRVDLLQRKGCNSNISELNKFKSKCVNALEFGQFLKELGFPTNTAIYLTQSRWHPTLDALRKLFPNVYTKEYSMPFNEERQILYTGKTQFEKALDFYICSESDIFIPSIPGMFYSIVAGERISLGKTQMFVPNLKTFQDGDLVLKWDADRAKPGRHSKFDAIWSGPYMVTGCKSSNAFQLSTLDGEELSIPAGDPVESPNCCIYLPPRVDIDKQENMEIKETQNLIFIASPIALAHGNGARHRLSTQETVRLGARKWRTTQTVDTGNGAPLAHGNGARHRMSTQETVRLGARKWRTTQTVDTGNGAPLAHGRGFRHTHGCAYGAPSGGATF